MMGRRRPKPTRAAVATTYSVPAPVGGLNGVDALAAMRDTDAVTMENWFPQPNYIELRKGSAAHVTGLPGWVESLLPYASPTGRKMFAAAVSGAGAAFYDVSTPGTAGAAVVTSLTDARWESVNFSTTGGNYLYAFNGLDKPRLYNGTTWTAIDGASTPSITGVTTTKLRSPALWKKRLWLIEEGTLKAWYLPTDSIGGAAQSIDFGALFSEGGTLAAIVTATIGSGDQLDDFIGFLTTEGELAVYRGTDPASASTFAIAGKFRLGRPVGRRCWFKLGADVVMICADGFMPLSELMAKGRDNARALSFKILNLVNGAVSAYASNHGWQGVVHPIGNKLVLNVPMAERSQSFQYVMNLTTKAWTTFTGWNAACFAVVGDVLYFGGDSQVWRADYDTADDGEPITARAMPAFSYMRSRFQKHYKMVRPVIQSPGSITAALALAVDFGNASPASVPTFSGSVGSPWDTSAWDTSPWAAADTIQKNWQSVGGVGFAATVALAVSSSSVSIKLHAVDYVFENGGVL